MDIKKVGLITASFLMMTAFSQALAVDTTARSHVFDSAKHTRIYFAGGSESFADEVVEYKPGKKRSPHLWESAEAALGTPNFRDHEADRLARKPTFSGLGSGGSITLRFADNALIDGPGADLYIFEPNENSSQVKVEVSRDGKTWIDLGGELYTASEIDIGERGGKNAIYNFVRITDKSRIDPADQWPGADIDAVGALNSAGKISILDQSLCPADATGKKKHAADTAPGKVDEELKRVAARFAAERPSRLVVEVYSDAHGSNDKKEAAAAQPAATTNNPQAKSRSDAVAAYLSEKGEVPKEKLLIEYFDDARSLARRDVQKEHERDNRFDFVFLPYDRDTIIGDKTNLKVEHASTLIDGKWESEQGEVILITHEDAATKKVMVVGEWHESPARKGVIQSGTYDPETKLLTLSFYRTWSNLRGSADFKLSFDSVRLNGKWKGDAGGSGDWTLIRKN